MTVGQTSEGQIEISPGKVCGQERCTTEKKCVQGHVTESENCVFAEWHMINLAGAQDTVRGDYMSSET